MMAIYKSFYLSLGSCKTGANIVACDAIRAEEFTLIDINTDEL